MQETPVRFLGQGRSPGEGHGNPLQSSCLENPHGQRCLVGYSPWGCKESAERLSTAQHSMLLIRASLVAQLVKNSPAMQETLVQFLDQEDPLEKG